MVTLIQARFDSGFTVAYVIEKTGFYRMKLHRYETGKINVPEENREIFRKLYKRNDILFNLKGVKNNMAQNNNLDSVSMKTARKLCGLRSDIVAKKIGVSRGTLSHYENGNYPITTERKAKLLYLYREYGLTKDIDFNLK